MKLWSLLSKIHTTEWSGVLFFRMIEGSLDKPQAIVIEVLDFFLMDIGSSSFTSFQWGPEVTGYYDENPELLEEGIRTGCLHSHHNMGTFYSGEDVDDLVINTKDQEVDYYLTMIINTRGEWISRIGFRAEQEVITKTRARFWSKVLGQGWKNFKPEVEKQLILCMIPLNVEIEGYSGVHERFQAVQAEKYKTSSNTYSERSVGFQSDFRNPEYKWGDKGDNQIPLFDKVKGPSEEDQTAKDKADLKIDILMGKLFAASISFEGGLDAAVHSFRKTAINQFTKEPLENTIMLHGEAVVRNASDILRTQEGYDVSATYVMEMLDDLRDILYEEYVEDDDQKEQKALLAAGDTKPDGGEMEMFCDILDIAIEDMDTKINPERANGRRNQREEFNSREV